MGTTLIKPEKKKNLLQNAEPYRDFQHQ